MRVTDAMVESFLIWARNYGEIESWERVHDSGRKWLIRIPGIVTASGATPGSITADESTRVVPVEFVLTSREALAFGYGLATAGAHEDRAAFASREWGW